MNRSASSRSPVGQHQGLQPGPRALQGRPPARPGAPHPAAPHQRLEGRRHQRGGAGPVQGKTRPLSRARVATPSRPSRSSTSDVAEGVQPGAQEARLGRGNARSSSGTVPAWVMLHLPPPLMRIFMPRRALASSRVTRAPSVAALQARPASRRPAPRHHDPAVPAGRAPEDWTRWPWQVSLGTGPAANGPRYDGSPERLMDSSTPPRRHPHGLQVRLGHHAGDRPHPGRPAGPLRGPRGLGPPHARTRCWRYCERAEPRGLKVIIAAAGGAAHLAGRLRRQDPTSRCWACP